MHRYKMFVSCNYFTGSNTLLHYYNEVLIRLPFVTGDDYGA